MKKKENDLAFWFWDKEKDIAGVYGSISAIVQNTAMTKSPLYNAFSREKKLKYESDRFRVEKTTKIRAKRKKKPELK